MAGVTLVLLVVGLALAMLLQARGMARTDLTAALWVTLLAAALALVAALILLAVTMPAR